MLDRDVRDRIMCALNHEEGDRVPIWDYIDNFGIYKYFAGDEVYRKYAGDVVKRKSSDEYHQGMVKVYHGLGIDLCRGYGASFSEKDEEKVYTDAKGAVTAKVSGLTSWRLTHQINSLDELKHFEVEPLDEEWLKNWLTQLKKRIKAFEPRTMYVPGFGVGFGICYYQLMSLPLFSTATYKARADLERLIYQLNRRGVQIAEAVAKQKLCPMYFTHSDIAYKEALMFSPKFLRETFILCLRRTVEPLKEAGIKVIFHSDGYLMDIIPDLIEAGIDGLNPIEPMASMDIGLVKKKYGDKLVLAGNVDCSQVLPLGAVEEVREATKECIRKASTGGGHFIGSSSEVTPATPVENILAFYETCRTYGRYPLKSKTEQIDARKLK